MDTLKPDETHSDQPPNGISFIVFEIISGIAIGVALAFRLTMELPPPTAEKVTRYVKNCMVTILPHGWCHTPERIAPWMHERCVSIDLDRILISESTGKMTDPPLTTRQIIESTITFECNGGKIIEGCDCDY